MDAATLGVGMWYVSGSASRQIYHASSAGLVVTYRLTVGPGSDSINVKEGAGVIATLGAGDTFDAVGIDLTIVLAGTGTQAWGTFARVT